MNALFAKGDGKGVIRRIPVPKGVALDRKGPLKSHRACIRLVRPGLRHVEAGRILWIGSVDSQVIDTGGEGFHMTALVEYPYRQAFLAIATDPHVPRDRRAPRRRARESVECPCSVCEQPQLLRTTIKGAPAASRNRQIREVSALFVDLKDHGDRSGVLSRAGRRHAQSLLFRHRLCRRGRGQLGTKFEGDAALCMFGAPGAQTDHAAPSRCTSS